MDWTLERLEAGFCVTSQVEQLSADAGQLRTEQNEKLVEGVLFADDWDTAEDRRFTHAA